MHELHEDAVKSMPLSSTEVLKLPQSQGGTARSGTRPQGRSGGISLGVCAGPKRLLPPRGRAGCPRLDDGSSASLQGLPSAARGRLQTQNPEKEQNSFVLWMLSLKPALAALQKSSLPVSVSSQIHSAFPFCGLIRAVIY